MLLAATLVAALAAPEGSTAPAEAPSEEDRAQARAAFVRAREHAAAQRYEEAITGFEEALTLRPSPGLHYNIAVCHHRLMMAATETAPEHETHRLAAVASYNAYLDADPSAADRYAVAATVAELGGRPSVIDEWRIDGGKPETAPLEFRDDLGELTSSAPPADTEAPEPEVFAQPESPVQPTEPLDMQPTAPLNRPVRGGFPHGFLNVALSVDAHAPASIRDTNQVASLPVVGPALRMGGYIGAPRRWSVGGELAFAVQPTPARSEHRLTSVQVLAFAEWSAALGHAERFELGVGGTLGIAGQSLRHAGTTPAACPIGGGAVSRRAGISTGVRMLVGTLLGSRKQHGIILRVGPGVGVLSNGTKGSDCVDSTDPFTEYAIDPTPLLMRADVGYTFRW